MPQDPIVYPLNTPNRKILITYKKVDKQAIQGNFNLTKSGYNWLEIIEDETLEIKGVTSLKIHNLGDEEVVINGITLLPLPHLNEGLNKEIEGSTAFSDLVDKAIKRNSKIFVLPDGTYSDISLKINFLGQEKEIVKNKPMPYPFEIYNVSGHEGGNNLSGDRDIVFTPNKSGQLDVYINTLDDSDPNFLVLYPVQGYSSNANDNFFRKTSLGYCEKDISITVRDIMIAGGVWHSMGAYLRVVNNTTNEQALIDNRR